jgi:hypothetical protein
VWRWLIDSAICWKIEFFKDRSQYFLNLTICLTKFHKNSTIECHSFQWTSSSWIHNSIYKKKRVSSVALLFLHHPGGEGEYSQTEITDEKLNDGIELFWGFVYFETCFDNYVGPVFIKNIIYLINSNDNVHYSIRCIIER